MGARLKIGRTANDHINACGNHGGGMNQGADRRRAFHRVRQPDVERNLRAFAGGSHEQQQADGRQNADAGFHGKALRAFGDLAEYLSKIEVAECHENQENAEDEIRRRRCG